MVWKGHRVGELGWVGVRVCGDEVFIPNVLGVIACNKAEVEWGGVR